MNDELPEDSPPEDTASVGCTYCGAWVDLLLDPGGGPLQRYVEDCEICCRPLVLRVSWDAGGRARVEAFTEDDIG
jgi:hypothetical protein